jgi:hypothetical protein
VKQMRVGASGCWTCFTGKAASRAQQHWTPGVPGDFPESAVLSPALRWQQFGLAEADRARSFRTVPQHHPGGTAKTRAVATAVNLSSNVFIRGIVRKPRRNR